ncbi:hypothetical protein BG006_000423 [Podila minutissima]|uniref:Uncharacterized protein n=1 Tax=Podila minutissima TaxID=64525 RepID=A0A9P5VPD1_9FUNG|nr:hypothetical protein BG006_000423 [Podila minutissima]
MIAIPTYLLRLVRRTIGALAFINIIILAGGYIFSYNDIWDYNNTFLVFQQFIVNLFLVTAASYALSPKRQDNLSASTSINDRNREWSRRRRAVFTVVLAAFTLFYASTALARLTSPSSPGGSFAGCDAYGSLKQACVAHFFICTAELVIVVLLIVEGVFTFQELGLREEEERELDRMQDLPPIVVQYQPDLALPARALTRGEVVPGMELDREGEEREEEEVLPEYERHPKPRRGQQVVIVDMMHLEPLGQQEQVPGTSRLPRYDSVVEMSERTTATATAVTATAAAAEVEESSLVSTESTPDPLSEPVIGISATEEPSTETAPSVPTAQESLSSSSTEPETTQTSLPSTSSPPSLPRVPSYAP